MTNERTNDQGRRRRWIAATCVALVLAAVGDAAPEVIASHSLIGGYDGPGPLIYLGVAVIVATVRWRFTPLLAVAMSAFFVLDGLASTDFTQRLATPAGATGVAAWLQMLSFAAAAVCGTAAVLRRRAASPVGTRQRHFDDNSSEGEQ